MKLNLIALAVSVLSCTAAFAGQTKTVMGDMVTVTATVEAIELQSRTLTLKKADGTFTTFIVPTAYERFPGIKVGDTVTARYYDNIVFRKLSPGEKVTDAGTVALNTAPGTRPNATVSTQTSIVATVSAIDLKVPSITLTGPNKWVYSSKVTDLEKLKMLKVGDQIAVTWSEALSITVAPPKK